MSILDTFVTVFTADSASMKQGFNDVRKSTDDIVKSMKVADATVKSSVSGFGDLLDAMGDAYINSGIDGSVQTLTDKLTGAEKATKELDDATSKSNVTFEKGEKAVSSYAKKALGAIGIALSIGGLINNAVKEAADIGNIADVADSVGNSVGEVDAFGKSVVQIGGNANTARDELSNAMKAINVALDKTESKQAQTFKSLGVSLKDINGQSISAVEGILRLSDSVQSLSKKDAISKINALGITDSNTIELILKGRNEVERLLKVQKAQGVVTKESAERAKALKEALGGLGAATSALSGDFNNAVIPIITKGVEWLTKLFNFAKENQHFIAGLFIAIGAAVATYYVPPMLAAAAATLAATWPILLIISIIVAAAAAFALIYDDIMNFIEGNDSLIGRIFEKYPLLEKIVFAVLDAFKSLFNLVKNVVGTVADVLVAAYEKMEQKQKEFYNWLFAVIKKLAAWGDEFKAVFNGVANSVVSVFKWMWEQVEKIIGAITKGIGVVKNAVGSVKSFFGSDDAVSNPAQSADFDQSIAFANQALAQLSANPMNPVTSSAISNQSSQTNENNIQTGDINIQTQATDADGIASDVKGALSEQLKDLGQQNATGMSK